MIIYKKVLKFLKSSHLNCLIFICLTMKKKKFFFYADDSGTSSVVSNAGLVIISVLLIGLLLSYLTPCGTIYTLEYFPTPKFSISESFGGLRYDSPPVRFCENTIVIKHLGGTPINVENIEIIIRGEGNTYTGIPGQENSRLIRGFLTVHYKNISYLGKNESYHKENKGTLKDQKWSSGECIILRGNDSCPGTKDSSVSVTLPNNTETSDNYGFSSQKKIDIEIYYRNEDEKTLLFKKKVRVFPLK